MIDLLKDLEQYVCFEGVEGKGSAHLNVPSNYKYNVGDYYIKYDSKSYSGSMYFKIIYENEVVLEISCGIANNDNLSSESIISLYLHIFDDDPDLGDYDFASRTYKVMVEENVLGKYLSIDQIKDKETIPKIQNYVIEETDKNAYNKIYICTLNPDAINNYVQKYGVVIVTYTRVWEITTYYCYAFRDIYINPDGTIGGDLSCVAADGELDDAIEELFANDDYTYTEIS